LQANLLAAVQEPGNQAYLPFAYANKSIRLGTNCWLTADFACLRPYQSISKLVKIGIPMSLSTAAPRKRLHRRVIDCGGYDRDDGLWDIEGRLTDTKDYAIDNEWRGHMEPGTPLHDMLVRLTLDDSMTITGVEVSMQGTPFGICANIEPDFQKLVGVRIAPGFTMKLTGLLGGTQGCTHVVELIGRMATVAYQTIPAGRQRRESPQGAGDASKGPPSDGKSRPFQLNGCHAWAADGPLVKKLLPEYYEGPDNADPSN
jgi:hypothetical protein